jgi:choice-of-anchor C domain-containing protein
MKNLLLILALTLGLGLTSASAQLLNGSFEDGTDPGAYSTVNLVDVNNATITGWTVGGIDYIGTYWQAAAGSRSIDMNGYFETGSVSQTFATTPGLTYQITFSMSGNPDGGPAEKVMSVSATGAAAGTYTYITGTNTKVDMQWAMNSYSFKATSASTTLTFTSLIEGAYGPALDNVAIASVTGQVCHRDFGKPRAKTLTVGVDAIPAHIAHGDTAGPCTIG